MTAARCPRCDRPRMTSGADGCHAPAGSDLEFACVHTAVDWRARCLAAEAALASAVQDDAAASRIARAVVRDWTDRLATVRADAAREERARVVAWHEARRKMHKELAVGDRAGEESLHHDMADLHRYSRDAIERGEHAPGAGGEG